LELQNTIRYALHIWYSELLSGQPHYSAFSDVYPRTASGLFVDSTSALSRICPTGDNLRVLSLWLLH